MSTYRGVTACLAKCLNSVLNVKALVGAFNQEKAPVGAFSVIVQLHRLTDLRHYLKCFPTLVKNHISDIQHNFSQTCPYWKWSDSSNCPELNILNGVN